jgi:predicted regulator of Ras-like GTPase activity (Roadblock/LC7/MglB family)
VFQGAQDAIRNISQGVPGVVAVFLADIDSGFLEVSDDRGTYLDLDAAAAYYAQVIRQQVRALEAAGVSVPRIQNMVFESAKHYHALYPIKGQHFLCVVADQRQANLAMMWRILTVYAPQLAD